MRLTSCLVNGVELIQCLLVEPTTIVKETGDRIGTASLAFIGVAAELGPLLTGRATVEIWSTGGDLTGALLGEMALGETFLGGGEARTREFVGEINRVEPIALKRAPAGTGITRFNVSCQDMMATLDKTTIQADYLYSADSPTTDKAAIQEIFAAYAPTIDTSGITALMATLELQVPEGWSLRRFLNEVAGRSGAACYLQGSTLKYHAPTAIPAPFGIRDFQGEDSVGLSGGSGLVGELLLGDTLLGGPIDTIPVNKALFDGLQYTSDASALANQIVVKGKVGDGGVRVSSGVVEDTDSQAEYGLKSLTLPPDDNILTVSEAQTRAAIELAQRKDPQKSCSFKIRIDGLAPGQTLSTSIPAVQMSAQYFINRMTLSWQQGVLTYTVEGGFYRPNNVIDQRKTAQDAQNKQSPIYAIPAPLTITPGSFAADIQPVHIVNALPTLPDTNYPSDSVVILTSDHKLYRNASGTWTKLVDTSDLNGQITTTQITDGAISTPKLQANSVTATVLAALSVTAGKIAVDAVTAGTIATGAISAADAVFTTGAIQTADIANLAVTDAKINTLSASKLTAGTIDASVITVTNLNATNITTGTFNVALIAAGSITGTKLADGTVSDVKIASGLSATKITTGTLTVGGSVTIAGSISGTILANGTVSDVKIASGLSATKITTGTLDASIVTVTNLNASNITTGTLSATRIGAGTISVGSGGMTFTGSGGIIITGGGVINNSAGDITTLTLHVLTATAGWVLSGGSISQLTFQNTTVAQINATSYNISGSTAINSLNQFVGAGVNVGSNGVGCGGVNIVSGGVVTVAGIQVLAGRQTDPGAPSFASLSDVQAWTANLRTALRNHGLF